MCVCPVREITHGIRRSTQKRDAWRTILAIWQLASAVLLRPAQPTRTIWVGTMPRLQGKPSNAPAMLVTGILLLAAAFVVLEYFGVINVLPNFGRV